MRTEANLHRLVEELQGNCGDLFAACRTVGVSLVFVRTWMKDDKDVAAALVEAERVGAMQIQSEAIRRAVHGYEKGVYFKGCLVDTETVYSDGLMQTLLKGKLPEIYAKDADGGGNVFNGPTQINVMPRADNYEEWLNMRSATLAARDKTDALPAPGDQVIDLEAIPVPENAFAGLGL